jgi:hypothetical protein
MLLVWVRELGESTGMTTSDVVVTVEIDPGAEVELAVHPEIMQKITMPERHIPKKNVALRFFCGILLFIE